MVEILQNAFDNVFQYPNSLAFLLPCGILVVNTLWVHLVRRRFSR